MKDFETIRVGGFIPPEQLAALEEAIVDNYNRTRRDETSDWYLFHLSPHQMGLGDLCADCVTLANDGRTAVSVNNVDFVEFIKNMIFDEETQPLAEDLVPWVQDMFKPFLQAAHEGLGGKKKVLGGFFSIHSGEVPEGRYQLQDDKSMTPWHIDVFPNECAGIKNIETLRCIGIQDPATRVLQPKPDINWLEHVVDYNGFDDLAANFDACSNDFTESELKSGALVYAKSSRLIHAPRKAPVTMHRCLPNMGIFLG